MNVPRRTVDHQARCLGRALDLLAEPGVPTQPIYIPPVPSHPIAGQPPYPSQGPGFPSNPIVIPPAPPVEDSDLALVLVMTGSGEPVWFVIDGSEHVKPPVPTEPTPK